MLDEFTALHAEYHAELQTLARESDEYLQVLQSFSQASKLVYQRLSSLDSEQSTALRAGQQGPATSMSVH